MKAMVYVGFIFVLLVPCFLFGQMYPPAHLTAISDDNDVILTWEEPYSPPEPTELFYDDGSPVGGDPGEFADFVGVKFTPSSPCSLLSARMRVYTPMGPVKMLFMVVRPDGFGRPNLYDLIVPPETLNVYGISSWYDVALDIHPYIEGDFFVGVTKLDTLINYIFLDADTSSPPRSFIYDASLGGWGYLDGDLMIRATVVYPPGSEKVVFRLPEQLSLPVVRMVVLPTDVLSLAKDTGDIPTGYRVYRSDNFASGYEWIGDVDTTAYIDYDLPRGATYYYKVSSVYAEGESEPAGPVWATIYDVTPGVLLYDTLLYDDGYPSGAVAWEMAGSKSAVRFTAPQMAKLYALQYYFYTVGRYRSAVYNWDYEVGLPGEPFVEIPTEEATVPGWLTENVDRFGIYVDSFFVGALIFQSRSLSLGLGVAAGLDISYDKNAVSTSWNAVPDTNYFIRAILRYNTGEALIHLKPGWNMVSLPVIAPDMSADAIFPGASGMVYSFSPEERRYKAETEIVPGKGYFVLSLVDTFYIVTGTPVNNLDIPVKAGLNIVGAPQKYGRITDITQYPSGIMAWGFFWYNPDGRGYDRYTSLSTGKGYWIYCNDEGIIRIANE